MYNKFAKIYDNWHSFLDYESLAQKLVQFIEQYRPGSRSVLEVACGTGQFLRRLSTKYQVEGSDISPEMLAVAKMRCPGVPLHESDMMKIDIPHRFDVVACLFSSISYNRTVDRMNQAVERMAQHLNPGGILLIEPYFSPETIWRDDLRFDTFNSPEQKIASMYVTKVEGNLAIRDIHYLLGEKTGIEHFIERYEIGLFTDAEYRAAITRLGLEVVYDHKGIFGRGMYIGLLST